LPEAPHALEAPRPAPGLPAASPEARPGPGADGSPPGVPAPAAQPDAERRARFGRAAIIVPFHNAEATLAECLESLARCAELGAELHVVDDTSTDRSVEVARGFPAARLHRRERRGSSGGARNTAAVLTGRPLLVFVDADVVAAPEQVDRLLQRLASGEWDAVVGCYGEDHDHRGLISQYKNLWIRRTYVRSPRQPRWFWTAFCGVQREAFARVGGFNECYHDARGGVDFEFGWRLTEAGGRILLDTSLTCRHLKRFTLGSLLRNDRVRARGYVIQALTLRRRSALGPNRFANVRLSYFVGGVTAWLTVLAALALAAGAAFPAGAAAGALAPMAGVAAPLGAGALAVWLACQLRFLAYFSRRRGPIAAVRILPVLFLDQMASFAGVAAGVVAYFAGERAPSGPGFGPGIPGSV